MAAWMKKGRKRSVSASTTAAVVKGSADAVPLEEGAE